MIKSLKKRIKRLKKHTPKSLRKRQRRMKRINRKIRKLIIIMLKKNRYSKWWMIRRKLMNYWRIKINKVRAL